MYAVIDTSTIPTTETREQGEQLLASLQRDNPEAKWALTVAVVQPERSPLGELEQLYALASLLLDASKVNPFGIELQIPQLDGSMRTVTAVGIMNGARNWLDQAEAAH